MDAMCGYSRNIEVRYALTNALVVLVLYVLQTGKPKEKGEYLVTLFNGEITFNEYCCITNSDEEEEFFWSNWDDDSIIAWCSLSDIEPYKNE